MISLTNKKTKKQNKQNNGKKPNNNNINEYKKTKAQTKTICNLNVRKQHKILVYNINIKCQI